MSFTDHEIALVKSSFQKISPNAGEAAALFYARLFELDPSLRALFHGDMHEQGRKLMATLALAVESLERLDPLLGAVRALGARHAGYGVRDEHYDTVGRALLWTLEKGLGTDFTPAMREAWTRLYATLATAMQEAARSRSPSAPRAAVA